MGKIISFLTLFAMLMVSCNENSERNDNVYIVKGDNIEGSGNITRIMAVIAGSLVKSGIIAEAPFTNGGFELHLPSVLSSDLLVPLDDEKMKGVSMNTLSAKWGFLDFVVELPEVNYFPSILFDNSHLQTDGIAYKSVKYVYVDHAVTLSGVSIWTENIQLPLPGLGISVYEVEVRNTYDNLVLTAGWNKVCVEGHVDISGDLWKMYNEYSMKSTSECKWNLGFIPQTGEIELPNRWLPD